MKAAPKTTKKSAPSRPSKAKNKPSKSDIGAKNKEQTHSTTNVDDRVTNKSNKITNQRKSGQGKSRLKETPDKRDKEKIRKQIHTSHPGGGDEVKPI